MALVKEGQLFKEGVTSYREGIRFDIDDSGLNLFIYFAEPSYDEKLAIKKGKVKVGLYVEDDVIFFLVNFKGLNWMDAPYSVHLSKNLTKLQDIISNTQGYALNIYLVNAENGIFEGGRLLGLPNEFSKELKKKVEEQKEKPFNISNHDATIRKVYNKLSSEDMALFEKVYFV